MPSLCRDPREDFWEETGPRRIGQRRHCCKLERKPETVDHREKQGGGRELGAGAEGGKGTPTHRGQRGPAMDPQRLSAEL